MSKVKVVLAADCHVDGKLRKKGETVEIHAVLAPYFGEPLVETLKSLVKLRKEILVARAVEKGISVVPDDLNKEQLAKLILGEQ